MRNALAFLGGVLAAVPSLCATARAQERIEPRPVEQVRAPSNALELKVGTGYTQGFGSVAPTREMGEVAGAGIGVSADIDYRIDPRWSFGLEGQYQEFTAQQNSAARGLAGTLGATYHFAPVDRGDPFLRLGTGYRFLWEVDPPGFAGTSVLRHGFDFLAAKIGYDVRVSEDVALAPVIGADLNGFFWQTPVPSGSGWAMSAAQAATYIYAGLQGRFDVGGTRTAPAVATVRGITQEPKGVTAPQPTAPPPAPAAEQPERVAPSVAVTEDLVRQCKLHLDNIDKAPKFEFDESYLSQGDFEVLNQIAECFSTGPMKDARLSLVGHTDPRGPASYNEVLGMKRANTVAAYLEQRGVPTSRIDATSRGSLDARGTDEATWAVDRRVDISQGR